MTSLRLSCRDVFVKHQIDTESIEDTVVECKRSRLTSWQQRRMMGIVQLHDCVKLRLLEQSIHGAPFLQRDCAVTIE